MKDIKVVKASAYLPYNFFIISEIVRQFGKLSAILEIKNEDISQYRGFKIWCITSIIPNKYMDSIVPIKVPAPIEDVKSVHARAAKFISLKEIKFLKELCLLK